MSTTKVWKAEVKDAPAFLVYAATHTELLNCIDINVHAIERFVTATGGTVDLPGIELSQKSASLAEVEESARLQSRV